jgi:hypothetical protein
MKTASIGHLVLGIALCFMCISACDEESDDDHSSNSNESYPDPTASCQDDCSSYLQMLAQCDLQSQTLDSCLEYCEESKFTHLNLECIVLTVCVDYSSCESRAECIEDCLNTYYL